MSAVSFNVGACAVSVQPDRTQSLTTQLNEALATINRMQVQLDTTLAEKAALVQENEGLKQQLSAVTEAANTLMTAARQLQAKAQSATVRPLMGLGV
jgi:regulator of replication initiation timing